MDPRYIADLVGIPEVASLARLPMPETPLTLSEIAGAYRSTCPASEQAKSEALAAFNLLVKHARATTVDELTKPVLLAFKTSIEKSHLGVSTVRAYFSRIRNVVRFGKRAGLPPQQLAAFVERATDILWIGGKSPHANPHPIPVREWKKLLAAADGQWRAILLLALNLSLYMVDICSLKWSDLNLEKGTYFAYRGKTGIPRAAMLWRETIEAVKAIPHKGQSEFVFTSAHGTRYSRNGRMNDFADFRRRAGVVESVKFSWLRDAAYTLSMEGAPDARMANVLSGHKAPGLVDNYVRRNPQFTQPAVDAIYARYMR
jgi:integrase